VYAMSGMQTQLELLEHSATLSRDDDGIDSPPGSSSRLKKTVCTVASEEPFEKCMRAHIVIMERQTTADRKRTDAMEVLLRSLHESMAEVGKILMMRPSQSDAVLDAPGPPEHVPKFARAVTVDESEAVSTTASTEDWGLFEEGSTATSSPTTDDGGFDEGEEAGEATDTLVPLEDGSGQITCDRAREFCNYRQGSLLSHGLAEQ